MICNHKNIVHCYLKATFLLAVTGSAFIFTTIKLCELVA